jgi:hypothetical protein
VSITAVAHISQVRRGSQAQIVLADDGRKFEWYGERDELQRFLDCLVGRRSKVRQLIEDFRTSSRNPFPNWATATSPPATEQRSAATC